MKTFIGVKLYLDLKYFETVGTLVCIQYRGRRGQVLARYSHWDHDDLQTIPLLLGMGRLGKRSSCFRTTSLLKGGRLVEKRSVRNTEKTEHAIAERKRPCTRNSRCTGTYYRTDYIVLRLFYDKQT